MPERPDGPLGPGGALSFRLVRKMQGLKQEFAPELQAYQESVRSGDTRGALSITAEIDRRMAQSGTSGQQERKLLTGSMFREIFAADLAHSGMGPNTDQAAIRSAGSLGLASMDPQVTGNQALNALELGARMPGMQAQAGLQQAQTGLAQAQTEQLVPAQAAQMQANAQFLGAKAENPAAYMGGRGGDVYGRRLDTLTKSNLALGKFAGMANKSEIGREVLEANLGLRNMVAEQIGAPAWEIIESEIPDAGAKPGEPQMMKQYGFREVQQQGLGAGGGAGGPALDLGAGSEGMDVALPQGAAPQPQPRGQAQAQQQPGPDFQAAVQNPLGVLPQEIQQSLQQQQPVSETTIAQALASQGYTGQQTTQILEALKAQFGAAKPTPAPTATPSARPQR